MVLIARESRKWLQIVLLPKIDMRKYRAQTSSIAANKTMTHLDLLMSAVSLYSTLKINRSRVSIGII